MRRTGLGQKTRRLRAAVASVALAGGMFAFGAMHAVTASAAGLPALPGLVNLVPATLHSVVQSVTDLTQSLTHAAAPSTVANDDGDNGGQDNDDNGGQDNDDNGGQDNGGNDGDEPDGDSDDAPPPPVCVNKDDEGLLDLVTDLLGSLLGHAESAECHAS